MLDPYDEEMVQPASIDVRLGNTFLCYDKSKKVISPLEDQGRRLNQKTVQAHYRPVAFDLAPGGFALGSTIEVLSIPLDLAARFEGKSSLGRLGLMTHVTAGFIDPGFKGNLTVELVNVTKASIKLYPGMKIGQLCFMQLASRPDRPYGSAEAGSHYQGQSGPQPSRIHENFYRTGER